MNNEKNYEFLDTHMFEPSEEIYFDTSEKILRLSDELAEEIVLDNIKEQLEDQLDTLNTRINYVSLFREKYANITPDDDYYDEEYLKKSLVTLADLLNNGIQQRFGVELGYDLDYSTPDEYLTDMETLYEFLFIRQFSNIVDYINYKLRKDRENYVSVYKNIFAADGNATKDLFVVQAKKKFKNNDDVIIIHFIGEIIHDIIDSTKSAYDLFNDIVNLDVYEEYNNRMSELLINYGNKIVLNHDEDSAELYLKPLKDTTVFSEVRNSVLMTFLEGCDLDD